MSFQNPAVILVKPTLSQNIGSVARAMGNFGLTDLRLVNPQTEWLNADARSLAAGADTILENAQVFETFQAGTADLYYLYATTARPRDLNKEVASPKAIMPTIANRAKEGCMQGLVFGSEKSGLDNEDIALCDLIISIPLNPNFSSINLAQSLIIVGYELYQHCLDLPKAPSDNNFEAPAPREELQGFFEHLEEELKMSGYLRPAHKIPIMIRTLRNLFTRAQLSSQEVRSLRGVISSLVNPNGIYSRRPKRQRNEKSEPKVDK